MHTISVLSLKGGTGKSVTSDNIVYILAEVLKKKVLLIDNDKQGNSSKTFGKYDAEDRNTIARVMIEKNVDVEEIIKHTAYENIDIITANMSLIEANLKVIMDMTSQQQTRFKNALQKVEAYYDYCIIDNAPDINMNIINALAMTNDVIIPISIDQYSFDGLEILIDQIENTREDFNENIRIAGCLITQYENNDVNNQGIEWLENWLKGRGLSVFTQRIRRTKEKVKESTFAQMPVVAYSPRCGASRDYRDFVYEYLSQ